MSACCSRASRRDLVFAVAGVLVASALFWASIGQQRTAEGQQPAERVQRHEEGQGGPAQEARDGRP
ncbi:MAG: hypothetical protein J0I06_08250 [Planctomycetes bacterium]|nr:hypothetical protein [Planctomycetota bacterium]